MKFIKVRITYYYPQEEKWSDVGYSYFNADHIRSFSKYGKVTQLTTVDNYYTVLESVEEILEQLK